MIMKSTDVYTKLEFQAEILIVNFNPELKKRLSWQKRLIIFYQGSNRNVVSNFIAGPKVCSREIGKFIYKKILSLIFLILTL